MGVVGCKGTDWRCCTFDVYDAVGLLALPNTHQRHATVSVRSSKEILKLRYHSEAHATSRALPQARVYALKCFRYSFKSSHPQNPNRRASLSPPSNFSSRSSWPLSSARPLPPTRHHQPIRHACLLDLLLDLGDRRRHRGTRARRLRAAVVRHVRLHQMPRGQGAAETELAG